MEGLVATHGRITLVIVGLIALVALTSVPIRASGSPVLPNPSQWPSHSSIRINSDSDFTPANGVIGGDGTAGNPYEIAMWDIDASTATGIGIRNTRMSFFLHDVFIHEGGTLFDGLVLDNVSNARVEMVSVMRDRIGMVIGSVSDLVLNANYAAENNGDGIDITAGLNLTVTGNGGGHNPIGLHIESSSVLEVTNNFFRGGNNLGFGISGSADVRVSDNNFSSNGQGMIVRDVVNGSIDRNIVLSSGAAFVSSNLVNVSLSNNTLDGSVELTGASNGSVVDNRITSGTLRLISSRNVTIERNNVSSNSQGFNILESSTDIKVGDNTLSSLLMSIDRNVTLQRNRFTRTGLSISGVARADYASHTITPENLVQGRPILYYRDCAGLVVDGVEVGQLIVANCTNVRAAHLDVRNVAPAIALAYDDGVSVVDTTVSNSSDAGISLDTAANVTFDNVSVSRSLWGVLGNYLVNITIRQSSFVDNWNSIYLNLASDVTLSDSDIVGRGVGAGLYLQSTSGIVADRNRIRSLAQGILLELSTRAVVSGNEIKDNQAGGEAIEVASSSNVTVVSNNLTNNAVGVDLASYTRDVSVYNNRFIGNTLSAFDAGGSGNRWDAGYPAGGNEWSDYRGWDDCRGPNQDMCIGPDGLGDIPYPIQVSSADRYPILRTSPPNGPPVARFTYSPNAVFVNGVVSFDGRASSDPDGWPLRFDWQFGDGTNASDAGPTVTHVYSSIGTVTAILTVTDVRRATATSSQVLRIAANPVVTFTIEPSVPVVGQLVTFDGSASYEPGGNLTAWGWDFGDATLASGPVATHAFRSIGVYTVTLVVVDESGYTGQESRSVSVELAPPPPIILVNYTNPAGFRLPIPVDWTREENQVINGQTIELVLIGPVYGSVQSNIIVDTGYDSTVRESPSYLLGVANATIVALQSRTTDQIELTEGPSLRTIGGHGGVSFRIQYGTSSLVQKVAIAVSEAHSRYWLFVLTVDASAYLTTSDAFERMLAGFQITLAAPSSPILVIGAIVGVVAVALAVVLIVVVRARNKRVPRAAMSQVPRAPSFAQTPSGLAACPNCGTRAGAGDSVCRTCGSTLPNPSIGTSQSSGGPSDLQRPPSS